MKWAWSLPNGFVGSSVIGFGAGYVGGLSKLQLPILTAVQAKTHRDKFIEAKQGSSHPDEKKNQSKDLQSLWFFVIGVIHFISMRFTIWFAYETVERSSSIFGDGSLMQPVICEDTENEW